MSKPPKFLICVWSVVIVVTAWFAFHQQVEDGLRARTIRARLNSIILQGDTGNKIEAAFKQEGLKFSYDSYLHIYRAKVLLDESGLRQISIRVPLDEERKANSVEVMLLHKGL